MIFPRSEAEYAKVQREMKAADANSVPTLDNAEALIALDDAWVFAWRDRGYLIDPKRFTFDLAVQLDVLDHHYQWCWTQVTAGDAAYIARPEVQDLLVQIKVTGHAMALLFHKGCRPTRWVDRARWGWYNPFAMAEAHELPRLARFFSHARTTWSGHVRLGLRAMPCLRWTSLPTLRLLSLSTEARRGLTLVVSPEAGDIGGMA